MDSMDVDVIVVNCLQWKKLSHFNLVLKVDCFKMLPTSRGPFV